MPDIGHAARGGHARPRASRPKSRVRRDGSTFPIVGIGASAGGLDAFKKFFSAIPAESGLGFVLIQHLDPTRESHIAQLVGTFTPMPVVQVTAATQVKANRVYVIPPNRYLSIRKRVLRVTAPAEPRSLRMAVDFFLHSLAEDQHENAIGVLLSGTGADGTLGLKEIKAAGGMTMVQDPLTAQHDGMCRSAISGGSADYVVPAEAMGDVLLAYVKHASSIARATAAPANHLASVLALLRERTSFDFHAYKTGTLQRRIHRRMSLKQVDEISSYVALLRDDPREVTALFKDLLIHVTSFFRDPAAWRMLQSDVIRRLIADTDTDAPLRAWVPACATGEEAYSIAMVLRGELDAAGSDRPLQILASDVDADALEVARAGVYPEGISAHVGPDRLARFFVKGEHSYRVTKELRDAVVFAHQSLISDPPFSKLDVVSCRNLLIYLEPAVQERIITLLHFALVEGGCLFLGSAETIGPQDTLFEAVSKKWRIYRRIGSTRSDNLLLPVLRSPFSAVALRSSSSQPTPGRLAALAQHLLLQRYVPACVIIDGAGQILYFHGAIRSYLSQPSGIATQSLFAQARNGLRSKLRDAVRTAFSKHEAVVTSGIQLRRGRTFASATVTVEPLRTGTDGEGLWLVSFEEEPEKHGSAPVVLPPTGDGDETDAAAVRELEYELKTTRDDLQLSVEDLRAANEELMSVNEELQASNEQLETSKEELQSINEELTTVNTQLEAKILEVEASNNDLDNLLTSTNIATLFLDTRLRIRRFTSTATQLFNLIPSDVGRPLADITQQFSDPALLSDAAAVLEKPVAPKHEVQAYDGRWYVRQVLPYRTRGGQTEGIVITFSDVAAEALQEARLYAESIVDTVREPLLVLDDALRVCSANQSFYATFQIRQDETVGRSLYELGNRDWDIPQLRTLLSEILPRQHVLNDFAVEHDFFSIGWRSMLLNARALHRGGDRPDLILVAIEDLTERKRVQKALEESEDRTQLDEQLRQRQAELAHVLRISTIGELASGLAHELNQPLSAIANGVEACARHVRSGKANPKKLLALLGDASAEALRASDIVEHLRGFIEKGEPQFESNDLGEIVHNVSRFLRREMEQAQIAFQLDLPTKPLPIRADRIQIEQVVVNLMQNAIDVVRESGTTTKEIRLTVRRIKGIAELSVHDSGRGISAAATDRLFEPFFTTKPEGLGMGLAISRSIIEAHRGRIWVASDPKGGTIVAFTLPLRRARK